MRLSWKLKGYAETTMNELLSWYGYDKLDTRETQALNLQRFNTVKHPSPLQVSSTPDDAGSEDSYSDVLSNSGSRLTVRTTSGGGDNIDTPITSPSPSTEERTTLSPSYIICSWCQKIGMKLFTLRTNSGFKAFCSELCFTQCRRASFKRNKTCDWCKHIRHTINYVNFQDGEQILRFCSDKCLNQYKMNIFCKETQEHLQLHPNLQEVAYQFENSASKKLITPDLWLKGCKDDNCTKKLSQRESSITLQKKNGDSPLTPDERTISSHTPTTNTSPVDSERKYYDSLSEEKNSPIQNDWKESEKILCGRTTNRYESKKDVSVHQHTGSRCNPNTKYKIPPISANTNSSTARESTSNFQSNSLNPTASIPFGFPGTEKVRQPMVRLPSFYPPPPLNLAAQQHLDTFMRLRNGFSLQRPLGFSGSSFPVIPGFSSPIYPANLLNFPRPTPVGTEPRHASPFPTCLTSSPPTPTATPPVTLVVPFPIPLPIPIPVPIFFPLSHSLFNKNLDTTSNLSSHCEAEVLNKSTSNISENQQTSENETPVDASIPRITSLQVQEKSRSLSSLEQISHRKNDIDILSNCLNFPTTQIQNENESVESRKSSRRNKNPCHSTCQEENTVDSNSTHVPANSGEEREEISGENDIVGHYNSLLPSKFLNRQKRSLCDPNLNETQPQPKRKYV
ncbi:sine oculis-binding protein homolog isoform X2 [Limulus polyphemus]|uniref:Sine oculis-binding protein homolog isoform X2 n=1 Tax=Limulus polyphemus TaxID=6850 RepID=A0ABM1S0M2_LIMPO|nr:sine oculis-binding protein homolog isoform X2 [Limulus polyphemus]